MVIKGKVDKTAFSDAFKAKGIERSKDVEKFLANMTGDDAGIIHLFNWSSLIDEGKDLNEVLQASRHLASSRADDEDVGGDDDVRYNDEDVGDDDDVRYDDEDA